MPKLKEIIFGKKDKIKQTPTVSKQQQEFLDWIQQGIASGEGPLADIFGKFNEGEFQKGVAEPQIKRFKEELLPQLQEQFISGNQLMGSGFQRAQAKAGTDLQSKLAELMYAAKQQHKQNQIGGVNTALGTQQVQNIYKQGDEGALTGLLKGISGAAGQGIGGGVKNLFSGNQAATQVG